MPSLTLILGAFASFGGFLFGYDTGYIAGCKEMPAFLRVFGEMRPDGTLHLSTQSDSLITSILSAGTFFGALLGSTIGDFLGRRLGIAVYVMVFFVGVALQTWGTSLGTFSAGRVLAGLGVGGTSCLVPIYQAECAPRRVRGLIVSTYQWFITFGLLIAAIIVKSTKDMNGKSSYQIPIAVQFVWGGILMLGMVILPESPRWLQLKGKGEKARKALARITGKTMDSPEVNELFDEIEANIEHERSMGGSTWAACFTMGEGKNAQRVLTGMGIQALTQLTGINFIFYYGTSFFQNSGISDPFLVTIATNVVNVGMTIPGMFLIDRIGRRPMIMYGAAGMAVSQLVVAAVGLKTETTDATGQKVLVAFVCIFMGHFASTWAPLSWVITSELYPVNIRTKGMSLSTASNWLLNFALGYMTPYLVNKGPGNAGLGSNVFWIWGGWCTVAIVFAYCLVPETKQLSLEQVDLLCRNSTVRGSNAYRKYLLEQNIHETLADGSGVTGDKGSVSMGSGEKGSVDHMEGNRTV